MEAAESGNVVPLRPREETKAPPRNEVWDACVDALGYEPLTTSEKALWGKMTTSLRQAGATEERIVAVAKWYRRKWPTVDLTITALEKWYSHFLAMEEGRKGKKHQVARCPECEMSEPHHTADCTRKQS